MSQPAQPPDRPGGGLRPRDPSRPFGGPLPESVAWNALSYLLSGLLGFALPAWLLATWTGWDWLVPVGLLAGMAAALTAIWFRYGTERS
jgi:ATP synthase protein I